MGKRFEDALMKIGKYPRFLGDEDDAPSCKELLQGAKEVLDYASMAFDDDPATACAGVILVKLEMEGILSRLEMGGMNTPLLADMVHIDIEQLYTVSKDFVLASKAYQEKLLGQPVEVVEREVEGTLYYSLQLNGQTLELKNHVDPDFSLAMESKV